MGAALEALKGKQVEAIALAQPFPARAGGGGGGTILAWGGDLFPWQTATVFYSNRFASDRARAVNFMKGYVKASRYYHDAVLVQRDGRPAPGAHYDEVLTITAKYTGASPAVVRVGFPYQDRNGRLWAADIEKQMTWWQKHGFMKSVIPLKQIVDTSFLEAAVGAVRE
jgi:NitT/TauT family transport system substrate-binding protein